MRKMKPSPLSAPQNSIDPAKIEAAISKAVREAVLTHARLGHPVATYRDGQVVWVQPADMLALLAKDQPVSGSTNE
jgi:hypothetical protein